MWHQWVIPAERPRENPPIVCEAAPTGCPVVICFASCIGSSRVLELSTNRKSAPFPARSFLPHVCGERYGFNFRSLPGQRSSESAKAQLSAKQLADVFGQRDLLGIAGDLRH